MRILEHGSFCSCKREAAFASNSSFVPGHIKEPLTHHSPCSSPTTLCAGRRLLGSHQQHWGEIMSYPAASVVKNPHSHPAPDEQTAHPFEGLTGGALGNSEFPHQVSPLACIWTFIMYVFADEFLEHLIWLRIKINLKYHKELGMKNKACNRSVAISKGMFSLVKIRTERKHSKCKLLGEFIIMYTKLHAFSSVTERSSSDITLLLELGK